MRYTVYRSVIQVLGHIWQPGCVCAQDIDVRHSSDLVDKDGVITRESVQKYLDTHAGDFSKILDFSASIEHDGQSVEILWAHEENEMSYMDAMFPSEQ